MPGIARSTGPAAATQGSTSLVSLRNPLTWFGIFAAATFGLIGFSSTARVGKARGKVSLGKE
jgi:lauroyl/myristoyl acyltransferase